MPFAPTITHIINGRNDDYISVYHMHLNVNEIFYSIQGESLYAGLPCIFVRLTGCNLRCRYCDTRYAYENGQRISIETIIAQIKQYACNLVEITGGEPLCQQHTPLLISRLIDTGYTVLLETNGSKDIRMADSRCIRIVDIKCPDSGEADKNDLENIYRLTTKDQLKFVICSRRDYLYARQMTDTVQTLPHPVPILFSAVHPTLAPSLLAEWILADHLTVRLQIQLHKVLWPHEDKGR